MHVGRRMKVYEESRQKTQGASQEHRSHGAREASNEHRPQIEGATVGVARMPARVGEKAQRADGMQCRPGADRQVGHHEHHDQGRARRHDTQRDEQQAIGIDALHALAAQRVLAFASGSK